MIVMLGISAIRFKKPVVDRIGGVLMLVAYVVALSVVVSDFYVTLFKFSI